MTDPFSLTLPPTPFRVLAPEVAGRYVEAAGRVGADAEAVALRRDARPSTRSPTEHPDAGPTSSCRSGDAGGARRGRARA